MNLSICKLSLVSGWPTSEVWKTNCQAASKEDSDVGCLKPLDTFKGTVVAVVFNTCQPFEAQAFGDLRLRGWVHVNHPFNSVSLEGILCRIVLKSFDERKNQTGNAHLVVTWQVLCGFASHRHGRR